MLRSDGVRITFTTIVLLVLIEAVSWLVLYQEGKEQPFLYFGGAENKDRDGDRFRTLDPLLGYAHDTGEEAVLDLTDGKIWLDGFVVYAKQVKNIERPVIVALGGSTTDGINYGHSWSEELSNLLRANGLRGTVINGGTGGYASSQELLKLIRDGLSFNPDIVISYSGINDRGSYSVAEHLFIHPYQLSMMKSLVASGSFPLLQNTTRLAAEFAGLDSEINYSLGVASSMTLAERFKMNVEMMQAVSTSQGALFYSFIQPVAVLIDPQATDRSPEFVDDTLKLYEEILKLPSRYDYVNDATRILDPHKHYKSDGVHLTPEGDSVVATFVFDKIKEAVAAQQGN